MNESEREERVPLALGPDVGDAARVAIHQHRRDRAHQANAPRHLGEGPSQGAPLAERGPQPDDRVRSANRHCHHQRNEPAHAPAAATRSGTHAVEHSLERPMALVFGWTGETS